MTSRRMIDKLHNMFFFVFGSDLAGQAPCRWWHHREPSMPWPNTKGLRVGLFESHWARRDRAFAGPNQVVAHGVSETNHQRLVILMMGKPVVSGHRTSQCCFRWKIQIAAFWSKHIVSSHEVLTPFIKYYPWTHAKALLFGLPQQNHWEPHHRHHTGTTHRRRREREWCLHWVLSH